MDATTQSSAGFVVDGLTPGESIAAIEQLWLSPFWPPTYLHGDQAFANDEFRKFVNSLGSHFVRLRRVATLRMFWDLSRVLKGRFIWRLTAHQPSADGAYFLCKQFA